MKPLILLGTIFVCFLTLGSCKQNVNTADPGGTASAAIRVTAENTDAAEPAIAVDPDGNIYTLYVEHKPDKSADVYLQKFDGSLKNVGIPVRVNPKPGSAKAWRGDPPTIVVGSDRSIYVGWTRALEDKSLKGNDLLLSVSRDGGATFAEPVKVNDDAKPASHGMHSLTVDKENRIYFAWLDERNVTVQPHKMPAATAMHHAEEKEPNSEVFYAVSTDGGKTFSTNKMIAKEACPCCKTSLLAANGIVYAGWRQVLPGDFRHVAVARSSDAGSTFSAGVIVGDDKWQISACPVSGAGLSADADGSLNVVWYSAGDAGPAGIYAARSTDNGQTFAPRSLVDADVMSGTPVSLNGLPRGQMLVYAAAGGNVTTAQWTDGKLVAPKSIGDATLPAATMSNGKLFTSFVRNAGEKRSVWIMSN